MHQSEMATNDDPPCLVQMMEDFRAGGSARRRLSNVITRLNFDDQFTNNKCSKRTLEDGIESETNPTKYTKQEVTVSPWETQRIRTQLVEAQMQIASFENQIKKLHLLRKETELVFHKDRETLQNQLDSRRFMVKDLEMRLQTMKKQEIERKEELSQLKVQFNKDKITSEEQMHYLQKENSKLKDTINELKHMMNLEQKTYEKTIQELEEEISNVIQKHQSEIEDKSKEKTHSVNELELAEQRWKCAQLRIKELEQERDNQREVVSAAKSQHSKLLRYTELERDVAVLQEENRHLKDEVSNKLILEEMVQDLQLRQSGMEGREQELARVREQMNDAQAALDEWRAVASEHCDGAIPGSRQLEPSAIKQKLIDLQQKVLVSTSESSEYKSQLNEYHQKNNLLVLENQKLRKEAEKVQSSFDQQANKIKLLQKRLQLVSKERDSYRMLIDSYERELTISGPSSMNQQSQHQQQRIETLEKIMEGYREMLMQVNSDRGNDLSARNEIEKIHRLEYERDGLLRERNQLQKQNDELQQQLEYRALKGDFNPATSKVLHLRLNPAMEAGTRHEDELALLRAECTRLKQRVKLLEEGNTHNITQKVEQHVLASNNQDIQELKDKIQSQEIKMQRMMELFTSSAREFREVCYILFGYKMDRTQGNLYKLSHVYAESPDDHLLFKLMPDGQVDMVETSYSATLGELINLHLHQHNSFPLFLGAVTLDLYNQQTMISASS